MPAFSTAIAAPTTETGVEDTITPTSNPPEDSGQPKETATPEPSPTSAGSGAVVPVVIYVTVIGDTIQQATPDGDGHRRPPTMGQPHAPGGFDPRQPAYYQADYRRPYPDWAPNPRAYIVQPGDTVFGLARRFGVPPEAIVQANHLANPNYIRVGQVLVVP